MAVVVYIKDLQKDRPYIKSWESSGIFNWTDCQSEAAQFDSEEHARKRIKEIFPIHKEWLSSFQRVEFIPVSTL